MRCQDPQLQDVLELRSDGRRRLTFACPLIILTLVSLATTWQQPRALVPLLLFGGFVGGPLLWWGIGHRVEVSAGRVRHRMPLAPVREVALSEVGLVDIRPSDRRWPFRAYVVTLATSDGDYLPFETANFPLPEVRRFVERLLERVPGASLTDRGQARLGEL